MQPTFIPWLGWFDIADQSDTVVILDDVSFSKQSWQQRNRIRTPSGLEYLTLPVSTSGLVGQLISEAKISDKQKLMKIMKTIKQNYIKTEFFELYYESFCEKLIECSGENRLVDINVGIINWFFDCLNLNKKILLSSDLKVSGKKTERVVNICQKVGASSYLTPHGSLDYLYKDRGMFVDINLPVEIHNYQHPVYNQYFSPFISHASTLDLLMNEGIRSIDVIRSGRSKSHELI